jgi:uncharacterized repeat protein (TIGR01451 family)
MFGYIRRISLIFGFLLGSSSLFVIATSLPAQAADCVSGDIAIIKTVTPTTVDIGETITHTLTLTATSTTACTVPSEVNDFLAPSEQFQSTSGPATCTGTNPVSCTITLNATTTGTSVIIRIFTTATSAGSACDLAEIHPTGLFIDTNLTNNSSLNPQNSTPFPACATVESPSTTTPPGGDEDGEDGGTTTTTTIFTTETTTVFPAGGVQTGAGGAAHNSPLVPLTIAGGLLAVGVGSLRLRRRLGSR